MTSSPQKVKNSVASMPDMRAAFDALGAALGQVADGLESLGGGSADVAKLHEQLLGAHPKGPYAPAARYALAWVHYEGGDLASASEALQPLLSGRETPADLCLAARLAAESGA